jgi:glutathione S-transferase
MTIEIHWGSGSPNAWRVLLAAETLRIPYESKLLELSKGQHKTSEFLALNPRGKVPVLRDGDVVLYESLAILTYLDRLASGALYGTTASEAALTQRSISEFECYLREPLAKVMRHLLVVGGAPATPQTPTAEQAVAANEPMRVELATLSEQLKNRPWLTGDRFTAADAAVYPYVRLLVRAISKAEARATELSLFPFFDAFPELRQWFARVEELPGYEQTYPPHWRSAEVQPAK